MAERAGREPLVSVTLPVALDADPKLFEICLGSLATQTYSNFEALILISEGSPPILLSTARNFRGARVFEGSFNKSAARNFLARKAKGEYMLYVDVDMEFSPRLLADCVRMASKDGSQALIAPVMEAPSQRFWAKCRSLEKELMQDDPGNEIPLFVALSTFFDVGGFEEGLDPLDDWVLTSKLKASGVRFDRIQSPIFVRETTSLIEMMRRKYRRGQKIPALLQAFPDAPQLRFKWRFAKAYLRNWKRLLKSPIFALGLGFLKVLDILALSWGRLRPLSDAHADGSRAYLEHEVARTYEEMRLGDNFNRYKHYAEIRSLLELLNESKGGILEVGCGTGRLTSVLVEEGLRVFPLDPSPAMLEQFVTKPGLPDPVRGDGTVLPVSDNSVEVAYSLRVIWHLPTRGHVERMLGEMGRVASRAVVLDIANERRWRHPLTRLAAAIYFALRPEERSAHRTSTLFTIQDFEQLATQLGLRLDRIIPLDVLSPIWLRLLPQAIARLLYPVLFRIEAALWRLIPPGRFLIRLGKP